MEAETEQWRSSQARPSHWPNDRTSLSIGLRLLKSQDGHRPLASGQPMASMRRGLRSSNVSTWGEKEEEEVEEVEVEKE